MATKYRVTSIIRGEDCGFATFTSLDEAIDYIREGFRIHPDFQFKLEEFTVTVIKVYKKEDLDNG